ncbi:MAG TPA: EamA family transporter [Methylomirabilota bacterium]|nr:EamA family transporter [Methylomirabilota bacterium]
MSPAALALVVCAAALHAGWNAMAKRGGDPVVFLWLATVASTALLLPLGLWYLVTEGVSPAAPPFVIATILVHAFYFYALGRSYASGSYSLVYPVARGLGVALVPVLALVIFAERLSPLGASGIALVVAGIVTLHLLTAGPAALRLDRRVLWPVVTGLTIAAYSLIDKAGVARIEPVPYMLLMEGGCALLGLPLLALRRDAVRGELGGWRRIVLAAAMSALAYTLVLFAFRLSKTGYVVAARELSIVLSAVLGSLWLREGRLGPRLAGASIVLAGVACIALAR